MLTNQQQSFVTLLLNGHTPEEAGAEAGYSTAATIRSALASVGVQSALLAARRAEIGGDLAQLAKERIRKLITNDNTPAATAYAASKWVLEQAGHVTKGDDGQDKPLNEMTPTELERFLTRAQAVIDAGGEPPVISVKPDSGA